VSDPKRTWFPLTGSVTSSRAVARAQAGPIDPLTGPKLALGGRVVTMAEAFTVKSDGVVCIEKGRIIAVQDRGAAAPTGFADVSIVETGGTLFPGLMELHNHLSYNALPLWSPVPKRFEHRGQWSNHKDYRKLISGPMTVVGEYRDANGKPALLPALVRYVECKCLLGGVTTSQGVKLASNAGAQRFYRGLVRNVEQTDDPELPEALGRIADVDARDARAFLARLRKEDSCMLLHLSEGITHPSDPDSIARRHFRALEVAPDEWALNNKFAGIHAAGLLPEDFDVLAAHKGAMIWSPLSNLLLYGETARVESAHRAGVTIGLGSDWSPSGSKNLLGELKVAWLYNEQVLDGRFQARDIIAMATQNAARILKWQAACGSIEAGRRADLFIIDGTAGDPYDALIRAKETDIRLVMISGVARYGTSELMSTLAPSDQTVRVGGETRRLYLEQETADPDVKPVSLRTATTTLRAAFRDIQRLAREAEKPTRVVRRALDASTAPIWSLALDEIRDTGVDLRPRLPWSGPRDFTGPERVPRRAATVPLAELLEPIKLDALTVADDADFLLQMETQPNLPDAIKRGLRDLY